LEGNAMRLFRDVGVAVMVLGLALMACKKDKEKSDDKDEDKTEESKSDDKKDDSDKSDKKDEASGGSGDKVGVAACDEFIDKYEKCLGKMPAAAKPAQEEAMKQMRAGYKQAASTPAGKATLEETCKQQLEATKTAMGAYGCEW
jgi:hypothetical protein